MTVSRHRDRSIPDPNLEPTITVQRAGRILGMGRTTAYEAAKDGRLPVIPLSPRRLVVNTADFLKRYGLRRVTPGAPTETDRSRPAGPKTPTRRVDAMRSTGPQVSSRHPRDTHARPDDRRRP